MNNLNQISRAEMKKVLGGYVQPVYCKITVEGQDGFTEYGLCGSTNVNTCSSYAESKHQIYIQENGYPGCSWSCA